MTDPMTREQIEALDGHTPGPWEAADDEQSTVLNADGIPLAYFVAPRNKPIIAAAPALRTTCLALMDEVERLTSDRPFILGANHGYDEAMGQVAAEARRYASHYPDGSDGRNTFIIFAEWADRAALQEQKP